MATAYCLRRGKRVEIRNPRQITLKGNRAAVQGVLLSLWHKGIPDRESLDALCLT